MSPEIRAMEMLLGARWQEYGSGGYFVKRDSGTSRGQPWYWETFYDKDGHEIPLGKVIEMRRAWNNGKQK